MNSQPLRLLIAQRATAPLLEIIHHLTPSAKPQSDASRHKLPFTSAKPFSRGPKHPPNFSFSKSPVPLRAEAHLRGYRSDLSGQSPQISELEGPSDITMHKLLMGAPLNLGRQPCAHSLGPITHLTPEPPPFCFRSWASASLSPYLLQGGQGGGRRRRRERAL